MKVVWMVWKKIKINWVWKDNNIKYGLYWLICKFDMYINKSLFYKKCYSLVKSLINSLRN